MSNSVHTWLQLETQVPNMLESLVKAFWNEDVWLPPNVTWADIAPGPDKAVNYTNHTHVWYPIPLALVFIAVRSVIERWVQFIFKVLLRFEVWNCECGVIGANLFSESRRFAVWWARGALDVLLMKLTFIIFLWIKFGRFWHILKNVNIIYNIRNQYER